MAATGILADKTIRATLKAAVQVGKPRKISDGGGLVLEARPTGAGWWRLRYWRDGKEGLLSLGTYPEVSLKDARQRRDDVRKLVAAGKDPSEHRKAEKAERARARESKALADAGLPGPGTFEHVARMWVSTVHSSKVTLAHAQRTLSRLETHVFPWLGRRPIADIEAPDLLACLRRITARGVVETAHRVKDACGQVFRFGIGEGACQRNPAADLRDQLPSATRRHFAAITQPEQAGDLLRNIAAYSGRPVTRGALSLSALLLLRPGELRAMEWAWVDVDGAMLTVPGEQMKRKRADKGNGIPHLVPLAPQALAILEELRPLTGHGRYVFPSERGGARCMSENTVRAALRALGYSNDEMTAHGFRAMARTMAAERLNVQPEVIEAQLAHTVPDALGRAYNRTQYLDQRRALMSTWADYLDRIRDGAKVLPFKSA